MKNDLFLSYEKKTVAVKGILSGIGIFCAALTVLVFSTLFFSDVTLSIKSALDFSTHFALLFFSSYVMYFSLFDTGEEKASANEAYVDLLKRRNALFCRYRQDGSLDSLRAFCRALSLSKTEEKRQDLLTQCLLDECEVDALQKKTPESLTPREKRALWRLRHMKPVRISPALLLAERACIENGDPFSRSLSRQRRKRFFRFLLPTALTAFFSVSLAATVIKDPSADVIVGYLLKLFALLFNGVKGFRSGYAFVEQDKCAYMREQCFWLEEYFSSLEKEKKSEAFPPACAKEK